MTAPQITRLPSSTHEAVYRWQDPEIDAVGFIALHSTALGPAFGGARFWRYDNEAAALSDALRLSEGMSYKNALANLSAGGGKSVLWPRSAEVPRGRLFSAFGQVVESLGGRYITAEDVGTTVEDMETIRRETQYVAGLPAEAGRAGGDPSPWTALGVLSSIEAALRVQGRNLEGLTVAVQGIGSVGQKLCHLLNAAGARLIVSDARPDKVQGLAEALGATLHHPDYILFAEADVLSPCALGGVLDAQSIPRIQAKLIVGAANNQLAEAADAQRLAQQGIVYVPDYVANAGGIINAFAESQGEVDADVERRVRHIGDRVETLLREAAATERTPAEVAHQAALRLIERQLHLHKAVA